MFPDEMPVFSYRTVTRVVLKQVRKWILSMIRINRTVTRVVLKPIHEHSPILEQSHRTVTRVVLKQL